MHNKKTKQSESSFEHPTVIPIESFQTRLESLIDELFGSLTVVANMRGLGEELALEVECQQREMVDLGLL